MLPSPRHTGKETGEDEASGENIPAEHIGDHLNFCLCCCNLLCGGWLRSAAPEHAERHGCGLVDRKALGDGMEEIPAGTMKRVSEDQLDRSEDCE